MATRDRIHQLLIDLGLSTHESLQPFYPRVRDRDDLSVLRCSRSGVYVLSSSEHMDCSHYVEKPEFRTSGAADRAEALRLGVVDAERRMEKFRHIIANRKWLDVGTGPGDILEQLAPLAREVQAVEPQKVVRDSLIEAGYDAFADIEELPDGAYDAVTAFHVLEHIPQPLEFLRRLKAKLQSGGMLIVEVPHARDFLIETLKCEAFKAFNFWSERLLLHTRHSLRTFLRAAGFEHIFITGTQRYPVANHLHWLARGEPGGHVKLTQCRTPALEAAYADMLAAIDQTDTLTATAR